MRKIASLTLVLSVAFGAGAQGQLVGLKHLSTVPGLMNSSSGLATFSACSNGGTATQTIGVDVYGPGGAYVSGNSLPVAPNGTVLFGTTGAVGFSVDVNLATGTVSKGLARVWSTTSSGIPCSAFIADAGSIVPISMVTLSVVKKTSQKGG